MCLRDELIKDNSSLELHDFGKLGKHIETWTNTCSGFKKNTRVN